MWVSLRWKILLSTSALLVALIAAMGVLVNYRGGRFVNESIAADFEKGRRGIQMAEADRLSDLRLTAQLVASFPELKGLLATDAATIRDFLLSYQQENRRGELLIALDPAGRVVARTDTAVPEALPDVQARWVQPALSEQAASGVLTTKRGVYHAVAVPAAAAGTVFGFVLAGAKIDDAFARGLADLTQDEVLLAGDERILGSTMAAARLPWSTAADWEKAAGAGPQPGTVDLGGESYAALSVQLSSRENPRLLGVILRSRDRALAPYREIQLGLVGLGLLVAVAGITASAVLARRVTASIGTLVEGTQQVAAGNFDSTIEVISNDEIGDLAESFNGMLRGLRERADMQKFVSQSTVEMIQASASTRRDSAAGRRVHRGERRVLTILFSDVRGFTSMAKDRDPEDVVKLLNACLSLQADCVKKHQGDVDKFVGDAVVALFAGDDSAHQAVRCAVEIVRALDGYNHARAAGEAIQVGIGIVTGEVILGSIGSEDRRDFTVIGSDVNLCARLCSVARPREILLAESSYALVRDRVAAERLDPQQLKGFTDPIPVYRVPVRQESGEAVGAR